MTHLPKWSTPSRQAYLVKLFVDSGGFCVFVKGKPCRGEWEVKEVPLCKWGLVCNNPVGDGKACKYKPEEGKPHLPCHVHHKVTFKWHCAYGDYPCNTASLHFDDKLMSFGIKGDCQYNEYIRRLIREWVSDDKSISRLEWEAVRKAIHSLGERKLPLRGRFNTISMDIWHEAQPLFYIEGLGIDGLKLRPFAKVKLASSYVRLYVDLGDSLKPISKSARRKAIRYGKPLPQSISNQIHDKIRLAVRDYLNH